MFKIFIDHGAKLDGQNIFSDLIKDELSNENLEYFISKGAKFSENNFCPLKKFLFKRLIDIDTLKLVFKHLNSSEFTTFFKDKSNVKDFFSNPRLGYKTFHFFLDSDPSFEQNKKFYCDVIFEIRFVVLDIPIAILSYGGLDIKSLKKYKEMNQKSLEIEKIFNELIENNSFWSIERHYLFNNSFSSSIKCLFLCLKTQKRHLPKPILLKIIKNISEN